MDGVHSGPQVFVGIFSEAEQSASLEAAKYLRQKSSCRASYQIGKLGKQFKMARKVKSHLSLSSVLTMSSKAVFKSKI